MLSLFISIIFEFYTGNFLGVALLILLFVVLLAMTRFSGKKASHWQYAILCNLIYTTIFIYLTLLHYGTL